MERRRYPRTEVVHILLMGETASYFSGKVLDVSNCGMRVQTNYIPELERDQEVEMHTQGTRLRISNSALQLSGIVRWTEHGEEGTELGIEFDEDTDLLEWMNPESDQNTLYISIYNTN
ncbi:MAG: PilZ domain-containing protein [bacterium]|jgi:hypothetical protein